MLRYRRIVAGLMVLAGVFETVAGIATGTNGNIVAGLIVAGVGVILLRRVRKS